MASGFDQHLLLVPETQPPLTAETVAPTNSSIMADELVTTADKPPPTAMNIPPHSPQHTVNAAHHSECCSPLSPFSSSSEMPLCQLPISKQSESDDQLGLQLMVVPEKDSQREDEGTTAPVFRK